MPEGSEYVVGQRVRIGTEPEGVEPGTYAGKMAIVDRIDLSDNGELTCQLRVDRLSDPVSLPRSFLEPVITHPSSLLANDLFLPWDMDDPAPRLRAYTENRNLAGHILETLFIYDRVIIPTVDYSIIVPLVHWVGIPVLREMLESEAISFVRFRGGLGYTGGGHGLMTFELHPGEKPDLWWTRAARSSSKEAVILQLHNRLSGLSDPLVDTLGMLVEICTVDTSLPEFTRKVEHETYCDILGSEVLHPYFSIRNRNLKSLRDLGPDKLRVFSSMVRPAQVGEEIDITLRLAMLNLEAYMAEEAGARDMVTDLGFGLLLDAKVHRFTGGAVRGHAFSRIAALENLPDLANSIATGDLDLAEAWTFRNQRTACQFRQWFDKIGPDDPKRFEQEYVRTLRTDGFWDRGPTKVLRFIVVQGTGLVFAGMTGGASILASMGLSVADSFLLDKVRIGFQPRYFIDDVRHKFFSS